MSSHQSRRHAPRRRSPGSLIALSFAVIGITFTSCQKSKNRIAVISEQDDSIATLTAFVADSMSMPPEKVTFRPYQQEFIVDGDGIVSLADAQLLYRLYSVSTDIGPLQQHASFLVARSYASQIRVYANPRLPTVWLAALDTAIGNWNNTSSKIRMTRVRRRTQADVVVGTVFNRSKSVATAYYPDYYGRPGRAITVNIHHNDLRPSQKVGVLTQKLGNTLGLTPHHVKTESMEPQGEKTRDWIDFTEHDLLAIRTAYPR